MPVTTAASCEWAGYIAGDFSFADFPAGSDVADIGFGGGEQMRRLAARGCRAIGIEPGDVQTIGGRASGLTVCRAVAEALPFATGRFDGAVCKVVIPYTDEAKALHEIARILRPGGTARVSYHGLGYFLRYLLADPNWKRRAYAARVLVNTAGYAVTGRRLPGLWGDTLYQSERRLRRHYRSAGLEVVGRHPSATFAGAPVFIYHVLRRMKPARPDRRASGALTR